MTRILRAQRGVTLIELMIVVAIVAILATIVLLVQWQDAARKARLAADNGTAAALRSAVAMYYGKHEGSFPPAKASVSALVVPTPAFQCPGQDFTYDASNGAIQLLINSLSGC